MGYCHNPFTPFADWFFNICQYPCEHREFLRQMKCGIHSKITKTILG